jgi:hypothetical protein
MPIIAVVISKIMAPYFPCISNVGDSTNMKGSTNMAQPMRMAV